MPTHVSASSTSCRLAGRLLVVGEPLVDLVDFGFKAFQVFPVDAEDQVLGADEENGLRYELQPYRVQYPRAPMHLPCRVTHCQRVAG